MTWLLHVYSIRQLENLPLQQGSHARMQFATLQLQQGNSSRMHAHRYLATTAQRLYTV
jgi:hypothetical protein